jgi:hypothetical protein
VQGACTPHATHTHTHSLSHSRCLSLSPTQHTQTEIFEHLFVGIEKEAEAELVTVEKEIGLL